MSCPFCGELHMVKPTWLSTGGGYVFLCFRCGKRFISPKSLEVEV